MIHTVREILPELVSQIMSLLSSEETEQQEVCRYIYVPWSQLTVLQRPECVLRESCAGSSGSAS